MTLAGATNRFETQASDVSSRRTFLGVVSRKAKA